MADYGVNIKVGVQGQNNAKQLGEHIREIVRGLEDADRAFTVFSNKLKSFDQRRAQKRINDELDKTAESYRKLDRLQRKLLANDNSAIKAAEKRAKLEEFISKTISAGRIRRQSARQQFLAGDPGQYATTIGPQPDRIGQIRKITAAEEQSARQVSAIKNQLFRKLNRTQIDLLQDRIKRELDGQQDIFQNMMRLNKIALDDFDKRFKQSVKTRSEAIRLTGQTSPIGGAVGIPGSPAALAAVEQAQRLKAAQGSALIGGAFPLLFGQGLGAAVGGAFGGFGGGLVGGEFGFGLSLVGTQVGSLVDQLVQKAVDLGKALNPLTADTDAIIAAVGKADTEFASLIDELEAAGQSAFALQLATEELEKVVGEDGVEALDVFSAGIRGLQNDFTVFITKLSAEVAKAINALTGETSFVREVRELSQGVFEARQSEDPEIIAAVAELDALEGFGVDPRDRIAAQQKIVQLLKEGTKASRDSIELAAKEEERLSTQVKANKVAQESRYVVAAQLELAQAGNDLTNEAVVLAEKKVIQERYLAETRGTLEGSQERLLAADKKALALQQLANRVSKAETAERKRQKAIQDKANKEADRERERQQKEFERNEAALLRLQQKGAEQREQQDAKQVQAAGELIDKLHAERELRLAILDGTEEKVTREQRIEQLMKGQEDGMRGIIESYVELESAELKAIKQAEKLNGLYANIGQTIETGVVDMIVAATDKTKSLAETASNTLRQLASQLLRFGINTALGELGGDDEVGFFSRLFPKRALGGSVSSNRPYMVGERGPELFVPGAQGNIVPNNAMGGANVVVNVDASGTQAQGNQPNAKALGAAIGAAVQAELVKQKRPGGLLA